MTEKQIIQVTHLSTSEYRSSWPPKNLLEFSAWVQEQINGIPAEYREGASIEIDTEVGYGDSGYPQIDITYLRPETDEEQALRLNRERLREENRRQQDLMTLGRLMKQYGDGGRHG